MNFIDDECMEEIKAQGAIEYLTTYGWMLLILGIVLAALFGLGLFSPPINPECTFPAEFSCMGFIFYSANGVVSINLQQATQYTINVTAFGCNNQSKFTNMAAPSNPPTNQVQILVGGNYTFSMICYGTGSNVASITPGQAYKGYVLINYTDIQTSFPHSVIGQLIAKAV